MENKIIKEHEVSSENLKLKNEITEEIKKELDKNINNFKNIIFGDISKIEEDINNLKNTKNENNLNNIDLKNKFETEINNQKNHPSWPKIGRARSDW